jgi:YaaC-like Protein
MSRRPRRRVGARLEHEQKEVPFSAWPLARNSSRTEFQQVLFAPSPWEIARAAAHLNAPGPRLIEANAFLDQGEEMHRAAAVGHRANPLLLYHAVNNLAKALINVRGYDRSLEKAADGISEQSGPGGWELRNSELLIEPSAEPTVFQLLAGALRLAAPAPGSAIPILDLLPQVVLGHRLYRSATGAPEQFAVVQELQFMHDVMEKTVWVDLLFDSGRLARADVSSAKLITAGALGAVFHEVESDLAGRRRFEMLRPFSYDTKPWERLEEVVEAVRPCLWTTVGKASPYRVHHACMATANRVPQLLGLYLLHFALGSITGFRPHRLEELLAEPIGSFIVDFVSRQPEQLLYLLASEFAMREVAPGTRVHQARGGGADRPGISDLSYQAATATT